MYPWTHHLRFSGTTPAPYDVWSSSCVFRSTVCGSRIVVSPLLFIFHGQFGDGQTLRPSTLDTLGIFLHGTRVVLDPPLRTFSHIFQRTHLALVDADLHALFLFFSLDRLLCACASFFLCVHVHHHAGNCFVSGGGGTRAHGQSYNNGVQFEHSPDAHARYVSLLTRISFSSVHSGTFRAAGPPCGSTCRLSTRVRGSEVSGICWLGLLSGGRAACTVVEWTDQCVRAARTQNETSTAVLPYTRV